jgi:hypothetical protein
VKERCCRSDPLVILLSLGELLRLIEAPDLAEAVQESTRYHQPKNLRTWRCAGATHTAAKTHAPDKNTQGPISASTPRLSWGP